MARNFGPFGEIAVSVDSGAQIMAPDLDYFSTYTFSASSSPIKVITGIDASAGLTLVINETGTFILEYLYVSSLTVSDTLTVKLNIDGEDKWNSSVATGLSAFHMLGNYLNGAPANFIVNSSITLHLQTSTDTNISLSYSLRPVVASV